MSSEGMLETLLLGCFAGIIELCMASTDIRQVIHSNLTPEVQAAQVNSLASCRAEVHHVVEFVFLGHPGGYEHYGLFVVRKRLPK